MKAKASIIITCLSFIGIINYSFTKKQPETINTVQLSMDNNAHSLLLDSTINAISIGVYKSGETHIKHYGEIDKGRDNKPTDKTIYEIGSVSKTFAGTLVAQAELEGKLSLNDDIRKYLKEDFQNFEFNGNPIRIRHLISHTSRLPKFLPERINEILENPTDSLAFHIQEIESNYSKNAFFRDLHNVVLDTIPGTKDGYSSVDTELIAHILENVYGKSYNALIQEKICTKLGMKNTGVFPSEDAQGLLANGYITNNTLAPHMINTLWGAGGGMTSTMPDLMAYVKFQLDLENTISAKSHEVIYQSGNHKIGYYWPVRFDESTGTYYSHHGGAFGMQNYVFIFPEKELGISIITNQNISNTSNKLLKVVGGILNDLG